MASETHQGSTSRVLIVGGGLIGCLTAYYLTRAGVRDVTIVERDGLASGASGYSAGILTPYSGSNDRGLLDLSPATLALHAELAKELPSITGIDHGYDLRPYLRCAFGDVGYEAAQKFLRERTADGFDAEWLSGDEAREVCDWISPEVIGACATSIEPTLSSGRLTASAYKAARLSGAGFVAGEVTGFDGAAGSPNGVELADGSVIGADAIVIAMGPWSGLASDWLGYELPVGPQKGQLLYMKLASEDDPDATPSAAMHNMDEGGVILPRRSARTVLGATKEENGFDRESTPYAREFILPKVKRLSARVTDESVGHHTACLRPMPVDGKPYVGRAPGWDNVYVAAGHWSEGIHYGPITGKSISDLIVDGETEVDISAINASRLAT